MHKCAISAFNAELLAPISLISGKGTIRVQLTTYLKCRHKTIRHLAKATGIEETVLGKKLRSPGSSLQYLAAIKINVATENEVTLSDLAEQYRLVRPRVYSGRVGERIARACAEGESLNQRLAGIGMNRRQLEYLLTRKQIETDDQIKLRQAFRSNTIALSDRDFERHARGE